MVREFWQIVAPDAPARGWPGRRRYLAWQLIEIVGQAMFLLGIVWLVSLYLFTLGGPK